MGAIDEKLAANVYIDDHLTSSHCFDKAGDALRDGKLELADQWRQLGEAIVRSVGWQSVRLVDA